MVFGNCDVIIIREYKVCVRFHFSWNNPLLVFPKNARKNCMAFQCNHPSLRSIKLAAFITKSLHKVFCLKTRVSSSNISCMILFVTVQKYVGFFLLNYMVYSNKIICTNNRTQPTYKHHNNYTTIMMRAWYALMVIVHMLAGFYPV